MSEERREVFFDLLTKKAIYGLDEAEERQLASFDADLESELLSFEMTAAAITLTNVDPSEKMPSHLMARIADAAKEPAAEAPVFSYAEEGPSAGSSWFGWLGWIAAAAACVALGVNIYLTRIEPGPLTAVNVAPSPTPQPPSPAEMRQEMMRTTAGLITANWAPGNMKDIKSISGDVVWSDERQAGYMRLRGLPVNDKTKETYQLWIFDKTQDKATPIDGGTFDVTAEGDVIIPIDAKLKASEPAMFAITMEKPGGVVVSKREKIAALATVETKST